MSKRIVLDDVSKTIGLSQVTSEDFIMIRSSESRKPLGIIVSNGRKYWASFVTITRAEYSSNNLDDLIIEMINAGYVLTVE